MKYWLAVLGLLIVAFAHPAGALRAQNYCAICNSDNPETLEEYGCDYDPGYYSLCLDGWGPEGYFCITSPGACDFPSSPLAISVDGLPAVEVRALQLRNIDMGVPGQHERLTCNNAILHFVFDPDEARRLRSASDRFTI